MGGDLLVGPQRNEGRRQGILDGAPRHSICELGGLPQRVVGYHDQLDEGIELQIGPALTGALPYVIDRCVDAVRLPSHGVAMAIVERSAEHRESDDVGVACGVGERLFPVDANQEWKSMSRTSGHSRIRDVSAAAVISGASGAQPSSPPAM